MTIQSIPYKSAIVTLHDAAPSFSKRIFEFTDALESLGISFNIGVIPFYRHKEDQSILDAEKYINTMCTVHSDVMPATTLRLVRQNW